MTLLNVPRSQVAVPAQAVAPAIETSLGLLCACLDLGEPGAGGIAPRLLTVVPQEGTFREARVLVRVHDEPLGFVRVPLRPGVGPDVDRIDLVALFDVVVRDLGAQLLRHLEADGAAPPPSAGGVLRGTDLAGLGAVPCRVRVSDVTTVSVVVCTRDRAATLAVCLSALRTLRHEALEVVIVDNASRDDATRRVYDETVGSDPRFRYVYESRPGLSRARNRGLAEATGAIIAYTDDDVIVDPNWVAGLLRGFRTHPEVCCVTGLVAAAALEGAAERYFEARVTWSASCRPRVFGVDPEDRPGGLYPFSAGIFGTGANMAFRADMLRAVDGFDDALGAGMPPKGGEDLDIFVRTLLGGKALAYEPAALVWHHHRGGLEDLRKQMFAYGTGCTAYLSKFVLNPDTRRDVLGNIPRGLWRIARTSRRTRARGETDIDAGFVMPRGMIARELAGLVCGPVLYRRARRSL